MAIHISPLSRTGTTAQWQIIIVTAKIPTTGNYLCWKAGKDITLQIVVDCHKDWIQMELQLLGYSSRWITLNL